MGPEPFVIYSDARSSGSGCNIPGNCRCPCRHEWSFTEGEKEHASGIGYSHDTREVVQIVVEFPLCEELLCLRAVPSEYVRGLSKESVIPYSGVSWGRSSCSGRVSTPTTATTAAATAAAATATAATSSA